MRILLVEDEKYIARAVGEVLKKNNYAVDLVFDGVDGLAYAQSGVYDLIILDIMLPKLDGISLLQQLRAGGDGTAVILLTARNTTEDKIAGLDAGADDYLPKPFHTDELLARIRALGRRSLGQPASDELKFADLSLAPQALLLTCGQQSEQLSPKLAQLLELLIANQGLLLGKETILRKLWGWDSEAGGNHVEAHISLLRKALKRVG
ncbi:MAG: response regulator transcription factor, partial [Coriobacteriales bacterium]|nr:response regulator transcription factor [Coriobacteriales bacterium]